MNKKWGALALAVTCAFGVVGCASNNDKPAEEEVIAAIEAGDLTLEDAVKKNYVTRQWAEEYIESNSIPASNKMEAGKVGDFETTTIDGSVFTLGSMPKAAFVAFVDLTDESAEEFMNSLASVYTSVQGNGADVIVCAKTDENTDHYRDMPFTIISYNESLKEALGNAVEMAEGLPVTGAWFVSGSFISAWNSEIDPAAFVEDSALYAAMAESMDEYEQTEGENAQSDVQDTEMENENRDSASGSEEAAGMIG